MLSRCLSSQAVIDTETQARKCGSIWTRVDNPGPEFLSTNVASLPRKSLDPCVTCNMLKYKWAGGFQQTRFFSSAILSLQFLQGGMEASYIKVLFAKVFFVEFKHMHSLLTM